MDLLFREYASPFLLLDQLIPQGKLCEFLDTFEESKQEKELWEFYIHKLPAWDERTFEEFKNGLGVGEKNKQERPSDEQLETIIGNSYGILKDFKLE